MEKDAGWTTCSWNGPCVEYEVVYPDAFDSVSEATSGMEKFLSRYNQHRQHPALNDKTPDDFCFQNLPVLPNAAYVLNRKPTLMEMEILYNQTEPTL